ncbi:hypothetical protein IQ250_04580 [Pseudanabaenaceae cyanobacterium LEGE 13415]|nr:hypothetical protein [Pseudanabaenaceae cyanobacterium LEGE 13415]
MRINIDLTELEDEALRRAAAEDGYSKREWLRQIALQNLKQRGFLPADYEITSPQRGGDRR